jgi:hypothetical protein
LRKLDIELDEYLIKDEFRKNALSIIGSQKMFYDTGKEILFEKKKNPSISIVKEIINGKN